MKQMKQMKPFKGARQQAGYVFLVSLLIALVLIGTLFKTWSFFEQRRSRNAYVEIEGNALAQLAVGLRGFVAEVQGSNGAVLPANPWTVNGVAFLRPPACGGLATNPPQGYVPCNYTGATLGPAYSTTFRRDPVTNFVESRTVVTVPALDADPRSRMLVADGVLQAALQQQAIPSNGMFYTGFANVPANFVPQAPPLPAVPPAQALNPPPADRGRVLLLVDNAPSNDIWLRTDGTNQMNANLNYAGWSVRNARDGQFSGNVSVGQRMQIGQGLVVTNGLTELRGGMRTRDGYVDSIGQFLSEGIYDAEVLTGAASYNVSGITCPPGTTPAIYAAMQSTGSVNAGAYAADAVYDARVDVQPSGGGWRVTPVVTGVRFDLATSGNNLVLNKTITPGTGAQDMRVLVMRRCKGA